MKNLVLLLLVGCQAPVVELNKNPRLTAECGF